MIYLLDLNFTLITNSDQKRKPFREQIKTETYDLELLDLLKNEKVILLTARPQVHKDFTLQNIKEKTGRVFMDAYFNWGSFPHVFKEKVFVEEISIKYNGEFTAIESNPKSRKALSMHGVYAITKEEFKIEKFIL